MSNQSTYTELRTRYNTLNLGVPTEYPNESFTKPSPATIWLRFSITDGDERQIDIGNDTKTFRTHGVLTFQLFAPLNQGAVSLLVKADAIADGFRNWCGTTVTCRESSVKSIGNDEFGWYQINVTIPFQTDYIK
jgi:hypothetical protein